MKILSQEDLIEAGYDPGPIYGALVEHLEELAAKGITDKKYALKLLKRRNPPALPKMKMRGEPLPFSRAIAPQTEDEIGNLKAVERSMAELMRSPVVTAGTVLPDTCPAGSGEAVIPVGGAVVARQAIIPSAHSADICCSMYATFYEASGSVAAELDALTAATRFGAGRRYPENRVSHPVLDEDVWGNPFLKGLEEHAAGHMADQGDGNHFAYVGRIEITEALIEALEKSGHVEDVRNLANCRGRELRVLVTHHGSRGLGAHVYKRGQKVALAQTKKVAKGIPDAAAWIDAASPEGEDYWQALQYVARWTKANHQAISQRFLKNIGREEISSFGNEHNFVWKRGDDYYHGKGATPAWPDKRGRPRMGLIPLNMAEPILWVLGRNNPDYLTFAPHGAGRNLSRTKLKRQFPTEADKLAEIERSTCEVDVRWFSGKPDVSETPVAYKDATQVKQQIEDFGLADVIAEIAPLGCIMAGEQDPYWKRKEQELTPKQLRQIDHRADRRTKQQELRDYRDIS